MEFDLEDPLPPSNENFPSLFKMEIDQMPSKTYSQAFTSQASANLSVRHEMDGKLWIFRLVAIACVSLALKMRKTEFSVFDLIQDGGFMFDSATIQRMEMLILGALKWRMRSANPFCFMNYFITFLKSNNKPSVEQLKQRATEIILKAQNDVKLLKFKPSIISASALLCAVNDLSPFQFPSFRNAVCSCSYVDKEDFLLCYEHIQEVATEGYESLWARTSSSCTPVNVLDVHVLSSSISGSKSSK
ncbi:D6-type cyclin [Striga asiatica]|uniref:D6-type cyclin n=1 Tax=Striga asiatica TaxID=4170 RepID=A0A5A7R6X5_STRAF|nr:D6-type cyclin [Striga asiatica]